AERTFRQASCTGKRWSDLGLLRDDAHALATAARGRLDDQWQSQLERRVLEVLELLFGAIVAGKHRNAGGAHPRFRNNLRAHRGNRRSGWTNENQATVDTGLRKVRVLREK